jgi:hypothetical protein
LLSRRIAGRRAGITSALVAVAEELIEFHIGAIIALSAGMIVLSVFAAAGAALVLCAGEGPGSDPYLGGGLGYLYPSRC